MGLGSALGFPRCMGRTQATLGERRPYGGLQKSRNSSNPKLGYVLPQVEPGLANSDKPLVRFMEQLDEMLYEKDHIKSRLGAKTGKEYKLHHYGFLDLTDEGNLPNTAEESEGNSQSAAHGPQDNSPKDDEPNDEEPNGGEPNGGDAEEAEEPKDDEPKPDEPQPDSHNIGPGCDVDTPEKPTIVFTYSYQKLKDRVHRYSERVKEDFEWSKHVNRNCMGLRIIVPGLWAFPELSPAPGDPCRPYDARLDDGEIDGDLSGFSESFENKMLVAWFTRFDNQGYDLSFFAQRDILGRAHALSNLL
jgi:hypothetical protein